MEALDWSEVDRDLRTALHQSIREKEWPILLFGGQGTGKTTAAACVYSLWDGDEYNCKWWKAQDLVALIAQARGSSFGYVTVDIGGHQVDFWPRSQLEKIKRLRLLVLDDIGTRTMTDPQRQALNDVIDARAGLPLICTSNHTPAELAELLDARIVSRLSAGRMIRVAGKDRRPQRKILSVGAGL